MENISILKNDAVNNHHIMSATLSMPMSRYHHTILISLKSAHFCARNSATSNP